MSSKTVDLDKIKNKTEAFVNLWRKKLVNLKELTSREGAVGFKLWLNAHQQLEEFEAALEELLVASQDESFRLLQVATTFEAFTLPEEDLAQADWYRAASQKLDDLERSLAESKQLNKKVLTDVTNELKFISEAREFHQRYHLESIQLEVNKVYQQLVQALEECKKNEREKVALQKEQEKNKAAEIEKERAQAEAKKVMMESVKIKEKRLAIIEEKKRKIAEKELLEEQGRQEVELAEVKAKQAEHERQAKLQDAYIDLQLEEKINNWNLADIADLLQKNPPSLDEETQLKINAMIIELKARAD